MGHYLLNKETQKIELHFDKTEYVALSDADKSLIKSKFLWSNRQGAWVSREVKSHYWAKKVAEQLGLENNGSIGERLSYEEELQVKSEKAEARAERYEGYAENALARMNQLQSSFNDCRKDWSWLTQPVISGHRGSMAFARQREKIIARYERGFDEYKKSNYYKDRAQTAIETASNAKLTDKIYLVTRIKECEKSMKDYQGYIVNYENTLYKIQQGEVVKNYKQEVLTEDYIEGRIEEYLEKYDYEYNKAEFLESCLNDLGGVQFSKDTINKGDIVNLKRWGRCEVVGKGPKNISYKILTGGAAGMGGTMPYAGIIEKL